MTNFHIIFKSIEGKIKAGVVELPEKPLLRTVFNREERERYEQALANPVFFKEEKDEERIKKEVAEYNVKFPPIGWQPELDKPYKIEGVEIEIVDHVLLYGKTQFERVWKPVGKNKYAKSVEIKQFAFIKNDVFDTGARLSEQKEERQITEDDFRNFIRTHHLTDKWEKFIIQRKP